MGTKSRLARVSYVMKPVERVGPIRTLGSSGGCSDCVSSGPRSAHGGAQSSTSWAEGVKCEPVELTLGEARGGADVGSLQHAWFSEHSPRVRFLAWDPKTGYGHLDG